MKQLMNLLWIPAALLLLVLVLLRSGEPRQLEAAPQSNDSPFSVPCLDASLNPEFPHEVKHPPGRPFNQTDFDCFSWQSLVALNWAAGAKNGEPEPNIPFGHTGRDGLVVWSTYKQKGDVFLPDGANPCGCDTADAKCRETCWNKSSTVPSFDQIARGIKVKHASRNPVSSYWIGPPSIIAGRPWRLAVSSDVTCCIDRGVGSTQTMRIPHLAFRATSNETSSPAPQHKAVVPGINRLRQQYQPP